MKLTPLEIRKQEFSKGMRGYNVEEVRAYLETVADLVDSLQKETRSLSEKIVQMENRLSDFQMMEKTLKETLVKAEESSRRARDDSQRESELIIREAEVKAHRVVSEAHIEADHLKSEILMLQARKDAFIKKVKYLLQSQTELIEILEGKEFDLKPEEEDKQPNEEYPPAVS
ncbi:DivIVA domain-containing protein [bacterium]|nr:DivIVA domain-containing protein [bacterium]MBU1652259.1 DivIVA domain-containing protein [bacterium]